jgi:hypothetical protein
MTDIAEQIEQVNALMREAAALLPFKGHPVGCVQWVPIDSVQANDWNPNAVAGSEMRLLHTSIANDGYTQPIVTVYDPDLAKWIIVDGFHRYTVMRTQRDIYDSTLGYLPVVVLYKSVADRMAATVRHNRARGKHSVAGQANLVFRMLDEGKTDAEVCNAIGLEAEELARLKHITGFAKLHMDAAYTRPVLTQRQVDAKAKYAAEHPDEPVPSHI